jgi:hypothetical protein
VAAWAAFGFRPVGLVADNLFSNQNGALWQGDFAPPLLKTNLALKRRKENSREDRN